MPFVTLAPRVPPSRRGGVAIRLARPARGDARHVEARFFIERPLALEAGIKPGDAASVAVGQGDDAGWVRLAAERAGAFRFGRSGGKHGGGCVVSIGHTELFGRAPVPTRRRIATLLPKSGPSPFSTCQWIAKKHGPFSDVDKCGQPTAPGRSYCAGHCARAYVGVPARENAA